MIQLSLKAAPRETLSISKKRNHDFYSKVYKDVKGNFITEYIPKKDKKTIKQVQEKEREQSRLLEKDPGRYKLFTSDVGLFVTLAFKDKDYTENVMYNKLLSDKLEA